MAQNSTPIWAMAHGPDEFGIAITFPPHSDTPARVFRVMTSLIEAFQEVDSLLLSSIKTTLRPTLLLEDIESGSIRVWLRNALLAIDDEALKSGDWKKLLGAFLVKAKRILIEFTRERTTVTHESDIRKLKTLLQVERPEQMSLRFPCMRRFQKLNSRDHLN
jgi:hypothetical protein